MRSPATGALEIPLFALLFLCFFQVLTDFVESTYAFGLLQTGIPVEIAGLFLLFAPVLLLPFHTAKISFLGIAGGLMLLCRAVSLVLDTHGKMLAAGVAGGAFLVFLPMALWRWGAKAGRADGLKLGTALALAVLLHILLRALCSGNDITGLRGCRWLGELLAGVTGVLAWAWVRTLDETEASKSTPRPGTGTGRVAGLCLGLTSPLVMLYFGFASPTVVARWTGASYLWMTTLAAGAAILFLALGLMAPGLREKVTWGWLLGWNLLFVGALALTLWSCQISFPQASESYPLPEPPVGLLGRITLPLMLLLMPVLFVNFTRFTQALVDEAPTLRALAGGFALSVLHLLLAILAQVFTTVYDYIPGVGPWFRDRFWLVGLGVGLVMVLPVLLLRRKSSLPESELGGFRPAGLVAAGGAIALVAVLALKLTEARPSPAPARSSLRIMTFNIQQGYSAGGIKNFAGQLELIRQANPDLVGLQESDTARMAGGNSDVVRYLADRLNYHSCYGPRTVNGTFGIALLSRYPMDKTRSFYLHSTREQTAALEAEVRVGGQVYHVFVTHLGNGGPLIQQQNALKEVAGKSPVIFMGDFNSTPTEEAYRLAVGTLEDAWLTAAQRRVNPPGQNMAKRIDHIFLSPGTRVRRADYQGPGASDHPVLTVDIGE